MTRGELERRSQDFYRYQRRVILVGCSVMIAAFFAWQPVLIFLFEKGSPEWHAASRSFSGAHFGLSAVVVAIMAWLIGAAPRRLGLTCPGCGSRLVGKHQDRVSVTGACGKCGAPVVQAGAGEV